MGSILKLILSNWRCLYISLRRTRNFNKVFNRVRIPGRCTGYLLAGVFCNGKEAYLFIWLHLNVITAPTLSPACLLIRLLKATSWVVLWTLSAGQHAWTLMELKWLEFRALDEAAGLCFIESYFSINSPKCPRTQGLWRQSAGSRLQFPAPRSRLKVQRLRVDFGIAIRKPRHLTVSPAHGGTLARSMSSGTFHRMTGREVQQSKRIVKSRLRVLPARWVAMKIQLGSAEISL